MNKKRINILIILWVVALVFSLAAAYLTYFNRGYTEVCFIDVGQGDSCFIRTDKGGTALIDGGDSGSGKYTLLSFFQKQFVRELDAVFISHLHSDHMQGIIELIDEGFPIGTLYVSETASLESNYDTLKSRADLRSIHIEPLSDDEVITLDDITFTVVAPGCSEGFSKNKNDNSVILRMDCGENSFLFTGDATQYLEKQLLGDADIDVDFLKVAHHGSFTSSDPEFVKQVSPDISVISVGIDNDYNHPSEETMETLSELGIPVLRTDYDGTITFIMTDDDIKNIETSRERGN